MKSDPAPSLPHSNPSLKRLWLLRAMAVFFALGLLGLFELVLRVAGYGYPTSFFLERRLGGARVLTENNKFGYRFFPRAVARAPTPFLIREPKLSGTYRIFVFGESAAMGDPEPGFGFSRILEVLLEARYPGTHFEVVNLAMTAINSHVILPIAEDCAKCDGDLWIIYMGNNEVHGPFGAGTVFGWQAAPRTVIRGVLALRALRLGQAAEACARSLWPAGPAATSWRSLEMFLDRQVAARDPRLQRVYSSFEANLKAILRTGSHAGVAQVLCTVGVNLKDMPPLATQHKMGLAPDQADSWERAYTNGSAAEGVKRFRDAVDSYNQAAAIDGEYGELQFRLGRCFVGLAQYDEARTRFEQARDLDALRFRADSRINNIIEREGRGRTNDGIYFLDVAGWLGTNSAKGLVGDQWFCDHVHFNTAGNLLVGRALAEQIAALLPATISNHAVTNRWLSDGECVRRLGWNDWNLYCVLQGLRRRMLQPPHNHQLGQAQRDARLAAQLADLLPATQPSGLRQAASALGQALEGRPEDPILHDRLAGVLAQSGDLAGALGHCQTVTRLLPFHSGAYVNLGSVFCRVGRSAEAEKSFATALRLDADSVEGLDGMGQALAQQGRLAEAIGYHKRSLRFRPESPVIRNHLAAALEQSGRTAEATAEYKEIVRLMPKAPSARVNLGKSLLHLGKPADAVAELRSAIELAPDAPEARLVLGCALEAQSNLSEAITEYRQVLRLDATNNSARIRLAQAEARQSAAH